MELNNKGLINDKDEYISKGYEIPSFDREALTEKTLKNPTWIHFGAGNIFRAFQANLMDQLISSGKMDTGLIVCEGFDYEIINKMYRPHDDLNVLVTLKADGNIDKKVIGSIAKSLILDRESKEDFDTLCSIFRNDSLKMASFTITEKGYVVKNSNNELLPGTKADIDNGPFNTTGYIGKVASLLYERYLSGKKPIAFVSMDNCSHNGDKLYDAIVTFAEGWVNNKTCEAGFLDYVKDPASVSFPWSMIDKITPRPDAKVEEILNKDGFSGFESVITSKNTYVAPFVNAEETQYLVIEDKFPNGKLPLDEVGVIYADKETVDKTEKMKVCTCLNPLHTALAVFGCLLGYTTIHDEMDDEELKKLVYKLSYDEGMNVVVDPKVLSPDEFLKAVLTKRLPNPFMPDTPQRIACDTSQKIPIRFGETIKAYRKSDALNTADLKYIPLVLAGWLRYLKGIDDEGKAFELSPDPMIDSLKNLTAKEILMKKEIFANDLFEDSLGDKVLSFYEELSAGNHAVRNTLKKYL